MLHLPAAWPRARPRQILQELARVKSELLARPCAATTAALCVFVAVQGAAMLWDLPTSYGWENDGVAPRGFFSGIAENLVPGKAYRYPLFHSLLIGVLALPVLVVDLVVFAATDTPLEQVVVSYPSMTAIALLTKVLHLGMAVVGLLAAERIWRRLFGERAARWAIAFTLTNVTVAYYARATNVDIAYLMWQVLALERLLLIVIGGIDSVGGAQAERRHYAWLGIFLAAALATKDQAYATFVLAGPLYALALPLWAARKAGAASAARAWTAAHLRGLAAGAAWAAASYLVLSGAVLNPLGFVARVRMLSGTNSQDWRQFPAGMDGWLENAAALIAMQEDFFGPWLVVGTAWLGALLAPWLLRRAGELPATLPSAWGWLPLVAGLSNTLAFSLVVGRAEHRFMLVMGYWLSGYAGVFLAAVLEGAAKAGGGAGKVAALLAGAVWLTTLKPNAEVLYSQWTDPRRDVERFLRALPAGTSIETYGLGVYLPRFGLLGDHARVTRVGAQAWGRAPTIPGVIDVQADFADVVRRRPDVVVVPDGFLSRFASQEGRQRAAMDVYREAPGAAWFFGAVLEERLPGYCRLRVGAVREPQWYRRLGGRAREVHGSMGRPVWVLARKELAAERLGSIEGGGCR